MPQTIFITGASKGIGLEIAQTLQQAGYRVFGTSRNRQQATLNGIRMLPLDITQPNTIASSLQTLMNETGTLDVLVNNAGFDLYGAAEETSPDEFTAQMDTNFTGVTHLIRLVLPIMRQQGGGKIINMSSIGGLVSLPYNSAYAASKFALEGYSESLRYELLPYKIYVSLVEPGATHTDTLATSIQSVTQAHPAYVAQRQRMVDTMRRTGHASPIKAIHIARTIQQIIESPAPRLRYPVGTQARLIPLLKALLPQRIFEVFVMRQFMQPVASTQARALGVEVNHVS